MAKLGNYNLFVLSESPNFRVQTTSYPVEKGISLTDHVNPEPETMRIEALLVGNGHEKILESLKQSMYKGDIFTYSGRFIMRNVIIEDITPNVDKGIKNGMQVSITLKQIRIATTPYKSNPQTKPATNAGKKQPTPKTSNSAVYHVTKRGDTYWGLSKKYGTSVSQLRSWNKYPDTSIPVGVKLRVK